MQLSCDKVVARAGTLLFNEGESGAVAYIIEKGRIEIFLQTAEGEIHLVTRGTGEIVGEMALIDRGVRSASARALDECELSVISEEQLTHRIDNTDPILRMCLSVVIDRYRETVAMLERGGARDIQEPRPARVDHMQAAVQTLSLESELRRAIARNELELFFQPVVDLHERRLAGFEALLRWNHPERGRVPPGEFIPTAEASGLIRDITGWCLAEVGRVFPRIAAAASENPDVIGPIFMSVNVSGHDLVDAAFMDDVAEMLARSGLPPSSIKLEVTESVLMKEPIKAAATLAECRALGLAVAIDDFGTGYSSLSHLGTMPITTIKIDQSFVRSMLADPTSRKIIQMILRLANELDIPVVAEGIEGASEAAELRDLGCAFGQGYLFARPQPLAETIRLAGTWGARRFAPGAPLHLAPLCA